MVLVVLLWLLPVVWLLPLLLPPLVLADDAAAPRCRGAAEALFAGRLRRPACATAWPPGTRRRRRRRRRRHRRTQPREAGIEFSCTQSPAAN